MAREGYNVLFIGVLWLTSCADERGGLASSRERSSEPTFSSGDLTAHLPTDAAGALLLENRRLGGSAAVSVTKAGGRGVDRGDGSRVYPSALGDGFDLELRRAEGGVRDRISLPHAPPGDRIEYRLELGPGVAGLRIAGGGVELLLGSGAPSLRVGRASVTDARGDTHAIDLEVEGCDVDRSVMLPWGRQPVPPGAEACTVVARLPEHLAYPAVYDPLWTTAGTMVLPRYGVTSALMTDGRVMAAGGTVNGTRAEVEVFDPDSETWSALPSLPDQGYGFTLTTLDDGRVLATGGAWDESSGIQTRPYVYAFSPVSMTWTPLAPMGQARVFHTATKLNDGRVLVVAGSSSTSSGTYLKSCEIFDPTAGTWSATQAVVDGRSSHTALNVGGGVLVAGGWSDTGTLDSSELFDPTANAGAGAWVWRKTFTYQRADHAMALLGADKVLIGGGQVGYLGPNPVFESHVEIYDIPTQTWQGAIPGSYGVGSETAAARVTGGAVVMAGGCTAALVSDCGVAVDAAWYFDPVTLSGHPASTIVARGKHQLVGLEDGRAVIFAGINGGPLQTVPVTQVFDSQPNGEDCDEAFACQSGSCVEGVCCDAPCDGECESCLSEKTGAAQGTCAPIVEGTDPDGECADDGSPSCGQNGFCKAGACDTYAGPGCTPTPCTDGDQCASGFCVDGVCCDSACDGFCEACTTALNGVGPDGVCLPVAAGRDPEGECGAADLACTERDVCDGANACGPASSLCAPYVCSSVGCETTCENDDGCQSSVCVAKACVPEESLCTEETKALARDGTVTDCTPFRCNADGTCRAACSSVDDCKAPFVCSPDSGACVEPPPVEGGDAGCACAGAGREEDGRGATWVALLGALAIGRGRRPRRRGEEAAP